MRWLVVFLACLLALPAQAGNLGESCLKRINQAENETPLINLKKDCPALLELFQQRGLLSAAEPKLNEKVSEQQLRFLLENSQVQAKAVQLNQDGLDKLLADILVEKEADPEIAWWRAFLKWLDSVKTGEYETEYRWLVKILAKIIPSEQTIRYFFNGMMLLLVLISGWFIVSECYRAGLFQQLLAKTKFSKNKNAKQIKLGESLSKQMPTRGINAKQEIAGLLAVVIQRMMVRGLLPSQSNLTLRQMQVSMKVQSSEIRQSFVWLVNAAEPVLFGDRPVEDHVLEQYWQDAEQLLAKLAV